MKFCNSALLGGGSSSGEYGDCGLFIVNSVGFSLVLTLLVLLPLAASRKTAGPGSRWGLGLGLGLGLGEGGGGGGGQGSNQDLKAFSLSSNYQRKLLVVRLLHYFMMLLAAGVFVCSVVEEVSGYAYVANFVSVVLRVAGWAVMSLHVQEFMVRRNKLLMGSLCWGTSQVATAGMSSIHYQVDHDILFLSLTTVLYFIATCLYVVVVIFQIIHKTERFEISNPLLYCNNSSTQDDAANDREVDREAMSSLYIKQQGKKRVSYDAPSAAYTNDDNESVTSSMFGSSQYPQQGYSTNSAPPLQRTASLRSVDLASEKNSPARPFSTSRMSSKWTDLRGQFRAGFGNDVTLRVLDWECFVLNENNRIALYRLELQESKYMNSVGDAPSVISSLVTKRHDELLFLHEKLSGCFPNIMLPKVPVPPLLYSQEAEAMERGKCQSNVEYTKLLYGNIAFNLHLQEMNVFLSALLAHEIVGQKAYAELRSVDLAPSSVSNRFLDTRFASSPVSKIVNMRESQVSIDDSWDDTPSGSVNLATTPTASLLMDGKGAVASSSCLEIPPFGHLHSINADRRGGVSSVRVTGVMEGDVLKGSSDKLFFLIEVCAPVASKSSPSGNSVLEPDVQRRTIKKKFKQFLTLNNILMKSNDSSIADIAMNNFPKLTRPVEGEEHKLSKNELVQELDTYLNLIYTPRNSHISLLYSFLETDIHDCTRGYDMIFSASIEHRDAENSQSTSNALPSIFRTIETDTKSFKQRMKHGNLRNKLFSSNDGKVLNENVPALNSLGANWVEEIMKANEILDSLGSEKLRTKEKRVSMTRDSSMLDIGVSTSGFSSSSSINNIVSDSLTKLALLVQHAGGADNRVQPYQDEDPTEFLQRREVGILNWRSTAQSSEVGTKASASTGSSDLTDDKEAVDKAYSPELCGVWLAQWRLRRSIASTTAFSEICIEVSNLKSLPIKQLKKAGDADKLSFLINLYNLISLHASIMLPWPHVDDIQGRCRWQTQARYQIGDIQLSLLQIEYALLRTRLVSKPLPTIPQCFDVPVPSPTDIKHLSSLLPKTVDVRALMALALPFRSSNYCYIYLSSITEVAEGVNNLSILQRELYLMVSEYLVSRIRCYSVESKVVVPKVLRRYLEDILLFRKTYEKVSTGASPQIPYDDGANLMERSSVVSSRNESESLAPSSQTFSHCGSLVDDNRASGSVGKSSIAAGVVVRGQSVDINAALRTLKETLRPRVLGKKDFDSALEGAAPFPDKNENTNDVEHQGDWEKAAGLESGAPQARSSMLQLYSKPCFGDKIIAESEFQQLRQILASELKIKNRTYHLKTYNDCFLGSDAVNCLGSYIPGGSEAEAISVGNNLIEYGVIRHVLDDHWLKPKDLFYSLGSTSASGRQMTPFLSFIMHHISENTYNLLNHQISSSDDMSFSVLYLPEDFRFKVPLKAADRNRNVV